MKKIKEGCVCIDTTLLDLILSVRFHIPKNHHKKGYENHHNNNKCHNRQNLIHSFVSEVNKPACFFICKYK